MSKLMDTSSQVPPDGRCLERGAFHRPEVYTGNKKKAAGTLIERLLHALSDVSTAMGDLYRGPRDGKVRPERESYRAPRPGRAPGGQAGDRQPPRTHLPGRCLAAEIVGAAEQPEAPAKSRGRAGEEDGRGRRRPWAAGSARGRGFWQERLVLGSSCSRRRRHREGRQPQPGDAAQAVWPCHGPRGRGLGGRWGAAPPRGPPACARLSPRQARPGACRGAAPRPAAASALPASCWGRPRGQGGAGRVWDARKPPPELGTGARRPQDHPGSFCRAHIPGERLCKHGGCPSTFWGCSRDSNICTSSVGTLKSRDSLRRIQMCSGGYTLTAPR